MVLSKRERYIVIGVAIAVAALALDYFAITPMWDGISMARDRKQALQNDLNKAVKIRAQRQQLEPKWQAWLRTGIKSDAFEAESQVYQSIHNWAQESGVTIAQVRSDRSTEKTLLPEISFQAVGMGTMDSISRLLYRVQNATIPIRIVEMTLASRKDGVDDLSMTLRLSTVYVVGEKFSATQASDKPPMTPTAPSSRPAPPVAARTAAPAAVSALSAPTSASTPAVPAVPSAPTSASSLATPTVPASEPQEVADETARMEIRLDRSAGLPGPLCPGADTQPAGSPAASPPASAPIAPEALTRPAGAGAAVASSGPASMPSAGTQPATRPGVIPRPAIAPAPSLRTGTGAPTGNTGFSRRDRTSGRTGRQGGGAEPVSASSSALPPGAPYASYGIVVSRNIFSKDRGRPPGPPRFPNGFDSFRAAGPSDGLVLIGVAEELDANEQPTPEKAAWFFDAGTGRQVRVKAGDMLDNVKVLSVSMDGIESERGGVRKYLAVGQSLTAAFPPLAGPGLPGPAAQSAPAPTTLPGDASESIEERMKRRRQQELR